MVTRWLALMGRSRQVCGSQASPEKQNRSGKHLKRFRARSRFIRLWRRAGYVGDASGRLWTCGHDMKFLFLQENFTSTLIESGPSRLSRIIFP